MYQRRRFQTHHYRPDGKVTKCQRAFFLCIDSLCLTERKDPAGRTYYVDHNSRKTTWIRPTGRADAGSSQRPTQQMADRRQIDDMHANSTRTSLLPAASGASTSASTDNLGPLPSGWQMSKNDSGRSFFIDHVNKRTTWVKEHWKSLMSI